MIDKNKKYKTRGGHEVKIYATNTGGTYSVHGAILLKNGNWGTGCWLKNGRNQTIGESRFDLIPHDPYLEYYNECGLKEGDTVKVLPRLMKHEDILYYWDNEWDSQMNRYIGTKQKIIEDCGEHGFKLGCGICGWIYPACCLEKVEPEELTLEEVCKELGREIKIVKGK